MTPVWNRGLAPASGVTPPLAGIFDSPNSGAVVNEKWKPLIISALAQLANNEHLWESGYVFGSNEIAKLIECLIVGDCAEVACEEAADCLKIFPDSGFIEYLPADPFTDPGADIEPYAVHPFSVGDDSILPGAQPTDVFTTFYNLMGEDPNPLAVIEYFVTELIPFIVGYEGENPFPRFKVRFSGRGTVSIKLLKVPLGGKAYITLDGNPVGRLVPLEGIGLSDLISQIEALGLALGSAVNELTELLGMGEGLYNGVLLTEEIVEIPVETDGDHYIDCTFFPWLTGGDLLPVDVGWGGGLRSITFCPDESVIEIEAPECPECPDPCVDCPPPPPTPPTLEQRGDCVGWINPATGLFECLLTIDASQVGGAAGGCSDCDECEEEDCEDCEDSEECDECA